MLDKTYEAAAIEADIAREWEAADAFRAGAGAKGNAEPFSIVIPPPNVTGSLHMGHALNNTLQDILARHARMVRRDVLWQPGTDHAGIATQMVVERRMAERGETDRHGIGRDAFVDRVWEWKAESGGTIINQLKRLGASCDWSRERFTMDEGLSAAVLKVFVQLYREGLIYRDKRLVNWDPKLLTAISDLEVQQVEVSGHMWRFAYPLADGPVDGVSEIVIATTRPETMLGDGAVAVHPSDERYTNLIGKLVRLPIAERLIPIIVDEYPDPAFGSGAVKITGAHDFNDFEVARRNDIPLIPLMDAQARMIVTPENNVPERYRGTDRLEARRMVVAEIEAMGLLRGVEEKLIAQPHGDRSGVVIEPMLTDQWYVDAKTLAGPAIAAVRDGRTCFVPENWAKTYFEWMENIQPWCISRQLWWGHRIPAWYGPDERIFVAEIEAEAQAEADAHYGRAVALRRDEDVLDTWFSSALWPFSTLGWPERTPELDRYYPTTVLVTGFDIIFFWVARMMMMGLHFMDEVPFHDVYIHALVRDEHGAKMSKSKGNVIDPLDLIDRFGADALRFTLAAMAAQGRDVRLSEQRVAGYRNFGTKLWNASRFCQMNGCRREPGFDPAAVTDDVNRWILTEAYAAARETDAALRRHTFNEAADAAYRFVWGTFCDWFIELAKQNLADADSPVGRETRAVAAEVLAIVLKLLHPFMPFVTEALWREFRGDDGQLLVHADWPKSDFADTRAAAEIEWLTGVVSLVRALRAEVNIPAAAKVDVRVDRAMPDALARVARHRAAIERLARAASIEMVELLPQKAVVAPYAGGTVAIALEGVLDVDAEVARLEKEIDKVDGEIERLRKKLDNPAFVERAKPELVADERRKAEGFVADRARLETSLERLRALA